MNLIKSTMLSDSVLTEGVIFKLFNHTEHTQTLEDPLVLNIQHFDET